MGLIIYATAIVLLCTCVSARPGHGRHGRFWDRDSDEVSYMRHEGNNFDPMAMIGSFFFGRPHPRPHPGPRRPPVFVGTFRSCPRRDWQINMYQVYNATGFPVEYVNELVNITIVAFKNETYQFLETVGNDTIFNMTFQLNTPVVVNGTNSTDGEYTFNARPLKLIIRSNSSQGVNVAEMQFGASRNRNSVNVVYHVLAQNITGARHFRRAEPNHDSEDSEEDSHIDNGPPIVFTANEMPDGLSQQNIDVDSGVQMEDEAPETLTSDSDVQFSNELV